MSVANKAVQWFLQLVDKSSGPLREVKAAADSTRSSVVDLDRAMDGVDKGLGRVGSGSAKLAGAMDLIVPGGGAAARVVNDLADAAEVGAMSTSALGMSAGTAVAALGVLAGVVAVGAAALWVFQHRAEVARKEMERLNGIQGEANSLMERVDQAKRAAELAGMTEAERLAASAQDEMNAKLKEGTRSLEANIEKLKARKAALEAQHGTEIPVSGRGAGEFDGGTVDNSAAIATVTAELGAAEAEAESWAQWARDGADAIVRAAEESERQADAAKAIAESERKAAQASRDKATEADRLAKADEERARKLRGNEAAWVQDMADGQDLVRQMIEDAAAANLTGADAINNDIDHRIKQLKELAIAYGIPESELATGIGHLETTRANQLATSGVDPGASSAEVAVSNVTTAMSGVGGAAQVATEGAAKMLGAGAAGPIGVAVGAGVTLAMTDGGVEDLANSVTDLGNRLGPFASDLADGVENFFSVGLPSVIEGIGDFIQRGLVDLVPAILRASFSPEVWIGFVEAIANAIGSALAGVAEMVVRAIGTLFDPHTWIRVAEAIGQAIADLLDFGIGDGLSNVGDTIKGWFEDGFESGTDYVPRTSMRLLHEGERVVSSTGAMSQGTRRALEGAAGRSGGGVHVHMPPGLMIGTVDEVVRELSRHMGSDARRLYLPAGSVG